MHQNLEEYPWYESLESGARRVISRAIHQIDANYGSSDQNVISPYYYHNGLHTRLACEDLASLRDALGLTQTEFMLGATAMAAHDVVKTFGRPSGVDETESADWLEAQLRELPILSGPAIASGRLAVMGTIPRFEDGTIVQKAVEQVYPTKSAERIAHAVAGADVGRLFTPEGPFLAHLLYKEGQAVIVESSEPSASLVDFQNSQIEFLLNYRYPRRDIETSLATHKSAVIHYLSKLSGMLEAGSIDSWEELIKLDRQFQMAAQN